MISAQIRVSGQVQGVGFRPFVYNLALRFDLRGFVRNAGGAVEIMAQGETSLIERFVRALSDEAPPLARIDRIFVRLNEATVAQKGDVADLPLHDETSPDTQGLPLQPALGRFSIEESTAAGNGVQPVAPDSSVCAECLAELFDPKNRRYRYPFINCTGCGPRFTIIKALPYDRGSTTMSAFHMCVDCRREYDDPANRRFHAQPNACSICGPSVWFQRDASKNALQTKETGLAMAQAVDCLRRGEILAVKGLGGFHLLCDATDEDAVVRLRARKMRDFKPMAVMVDGLQQAGKFCRISDDEEHLLTSTSRPIVLLKRRAWSDRDRRDPGLVLAASVSPGIDRIGVMIAYTPLHHLLLRDFGRPVVATSGNYSEEPIAIDNEKALAHLSSIADGFLLHDREIETRYDDSVSLPFEKGELMIRRSRGYAPSPISLPFKADVPVLACGGHLKNTFCLIDGDRALMSQHIGDLDSADTVEHFCTSLDRLCRLFDFSPRLICHDLHPDYVSTEMASSMARKNNLPLVAVQHHHAHIVGCMVENGLDRQVIGVAFDGAGYGVDGTIWGGEFLVCDWTTFTRVAHFEPAPMPGGSHAARSPWRMALGFAFGAHGPSNSDRRTDGRLRRFVERMVELKGESTVRLISRQVEQKLNSPLTSSCGRLFDAASAVLGICLESTYEGQAAMELETEAARWRENGKQDQSPDTTDLAAAVLPYELIPGEVCHTVRVAPILESLLRQLEQGVPPQALADRFHATIAHIILQVCIKLRGSTGIEDICLSGGVFQNLLLLRDTISMLRDHNFRVWFPRSVPANDGGLSLGQAVAGYMRYRAEQTGFAGLAAEGSTGRRQ